MVNTVNDYISEALSPYDKLLGTNATRELYWDEENRLMILSDNGRTSRYTYNHAGERIIKSHGDLEGVYINGAPQGIMFHEHDDFTLYPASIISINKNRFTKHYFIGSQRIASRIGTGRFNNVYGRNGSYVTAGQQDYAGRMEQIERKREEYYKKQGIAPGVPTMKGAYGDPENTGVGYNTIITELGDHSVPANWAQYVTKKQPGETPGPPIIWGDPKSPEEAEPGYGYIPDEEIDEETFYYHCDHLGSTSYITDKDGNVTQYTAYLPYGELLVDEHSSSEDLPYRFNGKELDEETGLYYYGARYMNPMESVWYGVDPLTEKYPNVSAYTYCEGNPVRYVDVDGNEPTKQQAGSVSGFVQFLNNTTTKMGTLKGINAIHAMERLAKIKMDKGVKPIPATTAPFNLQKDRYIYTEVGGWIDMSHFMFYAGRAYVHKKEKEEAQKIISQMSRYPFVEIPLEIYKIASSNPVGEALQEGYAQEKGDKLFAPHSAYSYEDLPTDKFAAEFGANYFNPNSNLSLGKQLTNYLNNVLKATSPDKAPNYKELPQQAPKDKPTRQNYTAQPVYTNKNP